MDGNSDGKLTKDEVAGGVASGFSQIDTDGDGVLDELVDALEAGALALIPGHRGTIGDDELDQEVHDLVGNAALLDRHWGKHTDRLRPAGTKGVLPRVRVDFRAGGRRYRVEKYFGEIEAGDDVAALGDDLGQQ